MLLWKGSEEGLPCAGHSEPRRWAEAVGDHLSCVSEPELNCVSPGFLKNLCKGNRHAVKQTCQGPSLVLGSMHL